MTFLSVMLYNAIFQKFLTVTLEDQKTKVLLVFFFSFDIQTLLCLLVIVFQMLNHFWDTYTALL